MHPKEPGVPDTTSLDSNKQVQTWLTRWIDAGRTARLLGLVLTLLHSVGSTSLADDVDASAVKILRAAFDTRFNFDLVQIVNLRAVSEMGEQSRTLQIATKRVGDSLHGLGYFTAPAELRGMRMLMIERFDRNDDFFLYLPTQGKVRRISSAQRSDAFMGTDLTYEDFERRYVDDYQVELLALTQIQGEDVYEIRCEPNYESGHKHAIYYVAKADNAILEIRYFRDSQDGPIKIQRTPRERMISLNGRIVPTLMWVEDPVRNRRTEVQFSEIRINPEIKDSLFTSSSLELGRPIPFLPK